MNQIIRTSPEQSNISAYLSSGKKDSFSLVVPMAATNLIECPSIYSYKYEFSVGVTLAASTSIVRRGTSAIQAIFSTPGLYMWYEIDLTSGTTYTWSFDLYKYDGNIIVAAIINPSSVIAESISCTINGYWHRYSITYTATATGTYKLRLSCSQITTFYTDGWMLIESPYDSTYIDGDILSDTYDKCYFWDSIPNYSQSARRSNCRDGGRIINFAELGIRTIAVLGASGVPEQLVTIKNALGGSTFQRYHSDEHQLSIIVEFITDSKYGYSKVVTELGRYLSNSLVYPTQPITLIYDQLDDCGNVVGESLEIHAYYEGGLDQQAISRSNATGKAQLIFRVVTPYTATRIGNSSVASTAYSSIDDSKGFYIKNAVTGLYSYYDGGRPAVLCIAQVPEYNTILLGGAFSSFGGFGGIPGSLIYYNRSTEAFSAIDATKTPSPGIFYTATPIPGTQKVLVGGDFSYEWLTGNNLAIINMATGWNSIGGVGANGIVRCSVAADSNTVYIGGDFTEVNGVAVNRIAKYTVSTNTFTPLGLGSSISIYALAVDSAGNLYATGRGIFDGGYNSIAKWDGTSWHGLGTGLIGVSADTMALLVSSVGEVYVGGTFTHAGSVLANGLAKWNGISWSALGAGLEAGDSVSGLREEDGKIYACGKITKAGNLGDVEGFAIWDGTSWGRDDIRGTTAAVHTPGARATQRDIYNGNLYIIRYWYADSYLNIPVVTSIVNLGDCKTYPTIVFPLGSMYSITNVTTGKQVKFEGLTVDYGETVTLRCSYNSMQLISTLRGNISKYILPSSDLLEILPGSNTFAIYGGADTLTEKIYIQFKETYTNLNTVIKV